MRSREKTVILCIFEINGLFRINLLGIQCGLDKSSPLNAPFVLWHSGLKSSKKLNLGKKLALSQRFFHQFFFKNYYLFVKNTHPTIYIDLALAHTTFSIFGALWNKFLYVQSLILHRAQKMYKLWEVTNNPKIKLSRPSWDVIYSLEVQKNFCLFST